MPSELTVYCENITIPNPSGQSLGTLSILCQYNMSLHLSILSYIFNYSSIFLPGWRATHQAQVSVSSWYIWLLKGWVWMDPNLPGVTRSWSMWVTSPSVDWSHDYHVTVYIISLIQVYRRHFMYVVLDKFPSNYPAALKAVLRGNNDWALAYWLVGACVCMSWPWTPALPRAVASVKCV